MKKRIVLMVLSVALAGCAATGTQVSQQAATQFVEGKSTESEVIAKLGPPSSVMTQSGKRTLIYQGSQYSVKPATFIPIVGLFAGGANYTYSRTMYRIDQAGIVEQITHEEGAGSTSNSSQPAPTQDREPNAVR